MKKILVSALVAAMGMAASASINYNIRGTEFVADTIFHAMVGPSTSCTQLVMRTDAGRQMYVRYSITDMTNPNVVFSAVMGQDKYSGGETISGMSRRKSRPGAQYFLGVNGDFFRTSGQSGRGESVVGAPIGPCIADGKIYHGNNHVANWIDFSIDTNKRPLFGDASFGGTVTNQKGETVAMGQVNSEFACDQIELFTSTYISSTNLRGTCAEVQAVLAEGEEFSINKPFRLVVTSAPSGAGDMDIPADGFVIRGQGSTLNFVNNLKPGDVVTFDLRVYMSGQEVKPFTMISSVPKILGAGQVLETEYIMGQFSSAQPLTVMGYSQDGSKIIMVQIDGRSPISSGARTTEGADLLRQLGAWEGLNFDSGGSSTMYSQALGTLNVPSDGSERSDANGFFAISTAPDDSTIASIAFVDWVAKVPKYGVYRPKFFGYNQYGLLIDTDVQGVKVSCPESVGHMTDDATFYGDGSGDALLTAQYAGLTATVPVQILGEGDGLNIVNDSIITDTYRQYAVAVENTHDGVTRPVNPSALTWSSSDESVVVIDANTGVLRGVADGEAYVYGSVGEFADTMKVIVERPTAHVMPMDPSLDVSTWKITQTGGKNAVATAVGDGIDYTYIGASGRSPKIVLSKTLRMWSLPDAIQIRFNPGEAPVKNVVLGIRPNGDKISYQTLEPDTVIAGEDIVLTLPTASWIDADNMGNYPLVLSTIQLNMGTSTTGQQYTIHFQGFETVYDAVPAHNVGDIDGNGVVNVSDVTALINQILGTASYPTDSCDVDGNGVVNVSDVTALINLILG
ncbi:MAG: phosphodiester glycosidase family protein [Muribaculaceae bacterium]|nr:phosphodiester glycosidase family protein [Muribaculaceae bacterium]